ncbi:beta-lactamase family protein [Streptomyces sp. AV19]|uniref:serine hydrolase domain-containing protein n=1 Tax=Streptomyces sp. AV19 TaxID=2793068 RepID=UPI0018FE05C8|nr:serine hydrolase domain-containing protein [Streptomyces sp. AV19]MBH1933401.1 beta-lactamase family protein [Streptomyces sp. AV19]MDG4536153.1 beta-lactamase family protein [Streptomyces sp. AV19]
MTVRTLRGALTAVAAAAALAATALAPAASATSAAPAGGGAGRHAATQAAMEAQTTGPDKIPGVLGRAHDRHGSWHGGAGVADLTTHRQRLSLDRFRAGSISKVFSSVVLLQLESEGRLNLDEPVERRLPGVLRGNGNDGRRVTLRQLLNHSSGVYNYTEDAAFWQSLTKDFPKNRYATRKPSQLVATALKHRPYFEPGKGWHYSNTNYIVAGMVIEKVTGHSYADEIRRRVLRPLDLRNTTLPGTSSRMPDPHGRAYSKLNSTDPAAKIYDTTELNPSWGWAAGEIISTTGDLTRFYEALLGGRLLPRHQQRELLTTVPVQEQEMSAYGLGIARAKLSCGTTVWFHSGGIHGSTSLAASTAGGGHTAAFNLNGDWGGDLAALLEAEYCSAAKSAGPGLTRLASLR